MDNLKSTSSVIAQTPPVTQGKARVDLVKSDFDALVWQKGYDVYHDKAIKCPCRNLPDGQSQSSCKNCGGSQWVFVNRTETRMVVQSINKDTKFKEWSEEKLGLAKITAMQESKIAFMDRIILRNSLATTSHTLFARVHADGKLRCKSVYDIESIDFIYLFAGVGNKLTVVPSDKYTIDDGSWITLSDDYLSISNPTISIRYNHHPAFHINEVSRSIIDSYVIQKTDDIQRDQIRPFPVHAVGRLAHYVLDEENYSNDRLFDNSILDCDDVVSTKPQ